MRTLLQSLCILFVIGGIATEIIYGADLGFILITGGGFLFAVSVKVRGKEKK